MVDGRCAAPSDPCLGITADGVCATATQVRFCVLGSDGATASLASFDCRAGESCQMSGGVASCVLTAACRDGEQRCSDASTIEVCSGGAWTATTCPRGCKTSPMGDFCALELDTVPFHGVLDYEARAPDMARGDWGPVGTAPAQGFLVISARMNGNDAQFIDAQVTAESGTAGSFTIDVPSAPTDADYLIFYAVGTNPDGSLAFAVADPQLAGSTTPYATGMAGASPALWSWTFAVQGLADSSTLDIDEPSFSGAARVFDYLRYVYRTSAGRWPQATAHDPLLVWLGQNVEWDCGACEVPSPRLAFGQQFRAQIFMPGGPDQRYWSDSLIAHELGHWVMGTYGRAVGESGAHCVGLPTSPGLAWSEGYATWFSADTRADPVYVDKEHGSMFWFDLSQRTSSGSTWLRPTAAGGLDQEINENEIAAMLWDLAVTQGLGADPLDRALASKRMTAAPFERGYHRELWHLQADCSRDEIEDTGQSTTSFADFLDALACEGVAPAALDTATQPGFPYASSTPRCR
jgi:hypothetical protein